MRQYLFVIYSSFVAGFSSYFSLVFAMITEADIVEAPGSHVRHNGSAVLPAAAFARFPVSPSCCFALIAERT